MTHAELLRRHATDAANEGGVWFSGEYMDMIAKMAESLEAENAKLRELLVGAYEDMDAWQRVIASSDQWGYGKGCLDRLYELQNAMRELGIEVGR